MSALLAIGWLSLAAISQAQPEADDQSQDVETSSTLAPCDELPTGVLSPEELARLVPDGSPGKVRIRWRTETQEDNYGFNIHRADKQEGPYQKVNKFIIPGEGSTNIPRDYCFMDTSVVRGQTYFYYIESISTAGVAEIVEGTKDTRVKVKTVEEEREWLRKKAAGEDTRPATAETTAPAVAPDAPSAQPAPAAKVNSVLEATPPAVAKPAEKNPLE